MRIVCISDTHAKHHKITIPDGDLLLHAGDLTRRGSFDDIRSFDAWLGTLPHPHKVIIAGNHDFSFERDPAAAQALITNAHYLQDSEVTCDGVRIWGSPWQPWFFDWAFNLHRGPTIAEKWALIPETGIDILITHGPPAGHGDLTARNEHVGCMDLLERIRVIQPRLHVFGHIHEAYGQSREGRTLCVNASSLDLGYKPVHDAVVLDIDFDLK